MQTLANEAAVPPQTKGSNVLASFEFFLGVLIVTVLCAFSTLRLIPFVLIRIAMQTTTTSTYFPTLLEVCFAGTVLSGLFEN